MTTLVLAIRYSTTKILLFFFLLKTSNTTTILYYRRRASACRMRPMVSALQSQPCLNTWPSGPYAIQPLPRVRASTINIRPRRGPVIIRPDGWLHPSTTRLVRLFIIGYIVIALKSNITYFTIYGHLSFLRCAFGILRFLIFSANIYSFLIVLLCALLSLYFNGVIYIILAVVIDSILKYWYCS